MTPGEEVELICLGDTAHIGDLNLRMVRGTRIHTTLSAIAKSKDLEVAKMQGLVVVKIMKGTIRTESLPLSSPNLRATHRSAVHPGLPPPPQPEAPSPADQTLVMKVVSTLTVEVQKLGDQLRSMERVLSERLKPLEGMAISTDGATDKIASSVAEAVREALKEIRFDRVITVSAESGPRSAAIDAPPEELFIPTGIVPVESKGIETKKSVSEAGGVDEAGDALREARRKRSGNNG